MAKNRFCFEGETEQALIKPLKIGKTHKFNCWENDIKKIIRRFTIGSHVYIVFDTDKSLSESEISRFIRNITFISNQPGLFIHLLQQTKNLEDELVYACNQIKNNKQLHSCFDGCSAKEFKEKFLQISNLEDRLNRAGFNRSLLWSRELINCLEPLKDKKKMFDDIS